MVTVQCRDCEFQIIANDIREANSIRTEHEEEYNHVVEIEEPR
ncbi:MAG: hypothetical protein ABEI06_09045 [Halobacteriaceae archaeon]